ncbi:MAG: SPOR domain-containing protein [Trueperaceae bacterium]|nr:SPOR domain-containing protein [Truepera sp.]
MDWLRRNWPDLLIGVALVAVIAGIIATLISGGSFFPVGQGAKTNGSSSTTQSSTTVPGAGSGQTATPSSTAQPNTTQPSAGLPGTAESGSSQPAASDVGAAPAGGPVAQPGTAAGAADATASPPPAAQPTDSAQPGASGQSGAPIAVLPPGGEAPSTQAPSTPAPGSGAAQPTTPPPSQATAAGATAAPAAATAPAEGSSYRVSVGAFGNAENAQRLAATFQAAGYPVLLGTQGSLTIVLVGPYETEAQARAVAGRIKAGDFGVPDPTVYLYEPDGSGAGSASDTPATTSPATSAPPAATPPASTPPAPASPPTTATSDGRYLQVGAYGSRESALPQIERLQELGFQVVERTEGSLLKLLVGPYDAPSLAKAQDRLTAAGIESFAR